jgi:hypothetical protein
VSAPALTVYVQGQGAVSADQLNTFEQTCDTVSDMRAITGVAGMQIFSRGLATVNDGGGGEFYWDAGLASPVDNGYSIIAPTGSIQGAWVRINQTPSTNTVTWFTQTQWEALVVPAGIEFVILDGVDTPGDAPPRPMFRLASPPSPLQSWYVQSADGSYWQDSGPDFYPEWVGGFAGLTTYDNTYAFTQAWLAHLNLDLVLRILPRTYYFSNIMTWDINGFRQTGFQVLGAGKNRSNLVWLNTSTPPNLAQFQLLNSGTGPTFWSNLKEIGIQTNVNGIGVLLNNNIPQNAFNNCDVDIRTTNKSTGGGNIGLQIGSWKSSTLNVRGGGSGVGQGLYGIVMEDVGYCNGLIQVGDTSTALTFSSNVQQNIFTVDLELCTSCFQCSDPTCDNNVFSAGVMNQPSGLGTTFCIDNAGSSWLTIGRGRTISGNFSSVFANPLALDATWGGNKVKIDSHGYSTSLDATPALVSGQWFLNDTGHNVNIWFRGSGTVSTLQYLNIGDYNPSDAGTALTNFTANGVTFRLQYGQSINVTYTGAVSWTWSSELQ